MVGDLLPLRFAVQGWYAWAPGIDTRNAWRDWAGIGPVGDEPEPPVLPMMLRRRTTPLGNRAAAGVLGCGIVASEARYILASRHGELRRSLGILAAIGRDEVPSPAEFSMAVHHGLTGLLSIHTGNRLGHTAVAADADVFGYGLLEASACLRERPQEPVMLIYCDDELPDEYALFRDDEDAHLPLVVVLALGPAMPGADVITLKREAYNGPRGATEASRGELALIFVRFLLTNSEAATAVGKGAVWSWRRTGAQP